MRANAGLGLIALFALVAACGTEVRNVPAPAEDPKTAADPNLPNDLLVPGLKVKDIAVFHMRDQFRRISH